MRKQVAKTIGVWWMYALVGFSILGIQRTLPTPAPISRPITHEPQAPHVSLPKRIRSIDYIAKSAVGDGHVRSIQNLHTAGISTYVVRIQQAQRVRWVQISAANGHVIAIH